MLIIIYRKGGIEREGDQRRREKERENGKRMHLSPTGEKTSSVRRGDLGLVERNDHREHSDGET